MSNLEPPKGSSLDDSCTVIHDNTLYSYSSSGFLALALKEGAKWKKLDSGRSVTGGVCVGANLEDAGAAALFIVGGQGPDDYLGLQRYDFASGKWAAPITPAGQSEIVKNRQGHGAVYNKAANSIIVFGGTRDGSAGASAETYTIFASEPYTGVGQNAGDAAPGKKPLLFEWEGADIVMVGGMGAAAGKTYLYNAEVGWRLYGASLAQPFATDSAAIKATMIEGSDGSQNLLVFDMSKSPNTVERIVIRDGNRQPVLNSEPVSKKGKRTPSMRTRHMKRDLTQQNWPQYDESSAPTTTRNNYALAKGPDNMVVFSGGNEKDPIALFDANKEGWAASERLAEQKILEVSSTSSTSSATISSTLSTSSATSTTTSSISALSTSASSTSASATSSAPAETSDAAAPVGGSTGPSSNAILGITLGTIGGFLVILLVILLLLKRRKNRVSANQGNVLNPDEKDTVAFAKSTQPSASPAHHRGHNPQLSQESYSSVAILMGRMGPHKSAAVARKPSHDSSRSSVSSLHKQFKSTISKPIPQETNNPILQGHDDRGVAFAPSVAEPRPRNGPMEAQDGTRRSSGWNRYWSGGSALQILGYGSNKRTTVTSDQSSRYSESANNANPRATQDSATVPPLNFEGRPEVNSVNMNSVNTGSPVVSQYTSKVPTEGIAGTIERPVSPLSTTSGYSSGVPESINEMWENRDNNKPWGHDRAPSSVYQHSKSDSASAPAAPASGVSQQPQLAMAAKSSDMSWLNLGEQSRH